MFNLAFGDGTDSLDDLSVSDNGDASKVLATVVFAAEQFLSQHPTAILFASGSTPARNRLYRMGFTRFRSVIEAQFLLFGVIDGVLEPFEPGRTYEAFVAQRLPT